MTLALLAALLVAMGVATFVVAIAQLDSATDNALQSTAEAVVSRLDGQLPGATGGENGEGGTGGETGDEPIGRADTFALVLDTGGRVVQNARAVSLSGLPDRSALSAALASGRDLRTVSAGGRPLRLLTLAIVPTEGGGAPVGAVQAGIVLDLRDQQAADLARTILLVGLAGLAGAALLAVWLTGRALVPVRAAFATERRFVASASHELRTPAAVIRSSAEVLEREGLVREEGAPIVAGLVAEADRLAGLVADLLALSASRADPEAIHPEPLDLSQVASDATGRVAPLAAERGCAIETRAEAALPVAGDRDRLVQVLLVLLDNAIRHSPPGGTITVETARERGSALVAVTDQGSGVPTADRERIFEPFARAGGTGVARGDRAGLGLAIARAIVERHGGTIGVDDGPAGGARFTVRLPLRAGGASSAGAEPPAR